MISWGICLLRYATEKHGTSHSRNDDTLPENHDNHSVHQETNDHQQSYPAQLGVKKRKHFIVAGATKNDLLSETSLEINQQSYPAQLSVKKRKHFIVAGATTKITKKSSNEPIPCRLNFAFGRRPSSSTGGESHFISSLVRK